MIRGLTQNKILELLRKNPKAHTWTDERIGKKVGAPGPTVNYNIRRLREKGLICADKSVIEDVETLHCPVQQTIVAKTFCEREKCKFLGVNGECDFDGTPPHAAQRNPPTQSAPAPFTNLVNSPPEVTITIRGFPEQVAPFIQKLFGVEQQSFTTLVKEPAPAPTPPAQETVAPAPFERMIYVPSGHSGIKFSEETHGKRLGAIGRFSIYSKPLAELRKAKNKTEVGEILQRYFPDGGASYLYSLASVYKRWIKNPPNGDKKTSTLDLRKAPKQAKLGEAVGTVRETCIYSKPLEAIKEDPGSIKEILNKFYKGAPGYLRYLLSHYRSWLKEHEPEVYEATLKRHRRDVKAEVKSKPKGEGKTSKIERPKTPPPPPVPPLNLDYEAFFSKIETEFGPDAVKILRMLHSDPDSTDKDIAAHTKIDERTVRAKIFKLVDAYRLVSSWRETEKETGWVTHYYRLDYDKVEECLKAEEEDRGILGAED